MPYPGPFYPPPARPGTNGMAVTSLVTGILCCLWPAAIGFGISSLVQLRRRARAGRPQAGHGLAVAGLVLGVIGLLLTSLATIGLVNGQANPQLLNLSVGDCFREQPSFLEKRAIVTPCTSPHDGEVSGVIAMTDGTYPGPAAAQEEAGRLCNTKNAYVLDLWAQPPGLREYYVAPMNSTEWNSGHHQVVCYLRDTTPGAIPHSLRLDARTLSYDQLNFLQTIGDLDWYPRQPADRIRLQHTAEDMVQIRTTLMRSTWPASVRGPMAQLEAQLAADQPYWQAAAADLATPLQQLYAGLTAHVPMAEEVAVRAALGLTTRDASQPQAPAASV